MSVLGLIRFNWHIFLIVIAVGAATVGAMLYFQQESYAWLFGVAYTTILLRDLGQFHRWSQTWPLTRELIDWAKVERLASDNRLAA